MTIAKKIALVTGGNKGIGLEICRTLAGAGCTVLLGARSTERGRQAVRQLEQAGLGGVHFMEIDVTMQRTIQAAAEQIESQYGRLDIIAQLQHQIQIHRLQRIEGCVEHVDRSSRVRTTGHQNQSEFGQSRIYKNGPER